jgi:glucokinase
MATAAILLNGLPGSGKTTLGAKLAVLLGCPLLSKDAVKKSLADLSGPTISGPVLGGIAMDTVWSMAAAIRDGVVIESFWFPPRDEQFTRDGIARSGATKVVEVWCEGPTEFGDRAGAQPIALWPVVRVDTTTAVDFDTLMPELASYLLG